ncbi:hypothetical protein [Deinococcus multiflagellatus]|uniref:Uncharacterized protein n=1 Tax=Deinococcus multiflagellatus TaxID=1656887 RepID=A0ABW1ZPZ8_9DEIO|nr:hypothetical protein [Deinococcus multiflagellatus]MBZ9715816.1 hypothetical protein [Deinococcus multiflagellatus]
MSDASPSLEERWAQQFPGPAVPAPLPLTFSLWSAREQVLRELRADLGRLTQVRTAYRAFRQAQSGAACAARAQRLVLEAQARDHFFEACAHTQPVVARHVPASQGWDTARAVAVRLGEGA